MSGHSLALALRLPSSRIVDILNGKCGISPEAAMKLARYFGTNAQFWLNLQTAYELSMAERDMGEKLMPK